MGCVCLEDEDEDEDEDGGADHGCRRRRVPGSVRGVDA